ncbi:phosphodiester glycosidase family protein [Treponema parvum]|uniref:phosphodiester glycosidase family protein n=1 Tax=Treponema parvum TaxID=138851 RepID=UPI001AEC4023|nr:phosphodiester glycosidase family protein [Treponema parvum]QTQ16037.1 phosphodiester glycosidase family protein [Treponema parvum]
MKNISKSCGRKKAGGKKAGSKKKVFNILFLLIVTTAFLRCSSVPSYIDAAEADESGIYGGGATVQDGFTQIAPGCVYLRSEDSNIPLIYHLLKIDLNDSIALTAFPPKIYEGRGVKGEKTSDFAFRTGAFVALNATPFSLPSLKLFFSYKDMRIPAGVYSEGGSNFFLPVAKYSSISFFRNKAEISVSQTEAASFSESPVLTLGGFFTILKDGKKYGSYIDKKDSRTALGVSRDGGTLYVLCAEGEKKNKSRGLSYDECADVLLKYGAWEALEMDGGGSVSLYINGKNMLSYKSSRKVGLNLGFLRMFQSGYVADCGMPSGAYAVPKGNSPQ